MNAGRLQTNFTPGTISEQLVPEGIWGEGVHEWNFSTVQRFPRNPLQLLIFLGSLSSYIILWARAHSVANYAPGVHKNSKSHDNLLGIGGCCWSGHLCEHCRVRGGLEDLPGLLERECRSFFFLISVPWQHLAQPLVGVRRCWSWNIFWLPLLFSSVYNSHALPCVQLWASLTCFTLCPWTEPCWGFGSPLASVKRDTESSASGHISYWLGPISNLTSCDWSYFWFIFDHPEPPLL